MLGADWLTVNRPQDIQRGSDGSDAYSCHRNYELLVLFMVVVFFKKSSLTFCCEHL